MKNRILIIIVLMVSLSLFYIMNAIIPFFGDDIAFCYSMYTGDKVVSLSDLLESVCQSYFVFNGRMLCTMFMQSFVCFLGEDLFNVLNSVVFGAVIWLLVRIGLHNRGVFHNVAGWVIVIVCLFSLSTSADSLFYWGAGAGSYLWPLVFVLIFVSISKECEDKVATKYSFFYFFAGFILSLHHEVYVLPLSIACFIYYAFNYNKITKPLFYLLSGLFLATLFVVFSPGTLQRLANRTGETATGLIDICRRFVGIIIGLRIFYLLLVVFIYKLIKRRKEAIAFLKENRLFIIIVFTGMLPALISSGTGRTLVTTEIFSIILLVRILDCHDETTKMKTVFLSLFSLFICYYSCVCYESNRKWEEYRNVVSRYMKSPTDVVVVDDGFEGMSLTAPYVVDLDRLLRSYFTADRLAKLKAESLGKDSVRILTILPQSVLSRIKENERFFTDENKVAGRNCFYTTDDIPYYVMRYDSATAERIKEGYLSLSYSLCIYPTLKFVTNISSTEIISTTRPVCFIRSLQYGDYILYNKRYKSYAGMKFESLNILDAMPKGRFEIRLEDTEKE